MLITAFLHVWPEFNWEPCTEVGSLILAKPLVAFEPGTLWLWLQNLNPIGYSPRIFKKVKLHKGVDDNDGLCKNQ